MNCEYCGQPLCETCHGTGLRGQDAYCPKCNGSGGHVPGGHPGEDYTEADAISRGLAFAQGATGPAPISEPEAIAVEVPPSTAEPVAQAEPESPPPAEPAATETVSMASSTVTTGIVNAGTTGIAWMGVPI